jgi:hypothetical protein
MEREAQRNVSALDSNRLANPACGNQLECRWVQRSMAEPQGTIQKTAVHLHMIASALATQ